MSKSILWTIKIVLIFIVIVIMTITKEMGIPAIIRNVIGIAIVCAIIKYTPSRDNQDNNQTLNKQ